jgi:hypothetical protein
MYRDHADYDPNRIGAVSEGKIIAALLAAGRTVSIPVGQAARYDLVMEDERGLYRVQCKTGHLLHGAVVFRPLSLRAARRETEWRRVARNYQGQIDYFAVYCPENEKVYLIPIEDVPAGRMYNLRVEPAQNGQQRGLHWARDYEVKPRVNWDGELT